MTKSCELAKEPTQEGATEQSTPTKQAKITRFLPARKARENSKQSTPAGKRTRGGLVSAGEPDRLSSPSSKLQQDLCDEAKSPESKRNRPALAQSPPPKQRTSSVLVAAQAPAKQTVEQETAVKAVPAYQRFAHLLDAADNDAIDRLQRPHLPLPTKYQLLVRLQHALDSAISIQAGRGQRPVWHRLVPALQGSLNRTVKPEQVELLKHFLPGVYVTEPCRIVERGRRVDSFYVDLQSGQDLIDRQRKDALMASLLRHVEQEHERFLESLNVVLPKHVELRNWHPKFDLETVCDPQLAEPAVTGDGLATQIPDIIKQAIDAVRDANSDKTSADLSKQDDDKKSGNIQNDNDGKGGEPPRDAKKPLSLKERIRLKEQQADLEKMTGPSGNKSKLLFDTLPDLIERITFLFSSSKKSVLFLSQVHERLKQSMNMPWSEVEVDERLDVLAKHLGDWISVNRGDAPFTVKVDRSVPLNVLKERIQSAAPK